MGLTQLSFVLLPLCVIWMTSPDKLLKLTAVASCFEAAAALTIGSYGLQPGLAAAFTFVIYMVMQILLGARYPGLPGVSRVMLPFVLITFYAVISSFLMPDIFVDQTLVWPQKPSPAKLPAVLTPAITDINQVLYLISNCVFMVLAALYFTKSRLPLGQFVRAYLLGGFIAAGISAWQFASRVTGLPFIESLLYSNPDWAILTEQSIGAVPRINGPFSEPSALANYMASIVCASGWLLLQGRREKSLWLLFAAALLTIVLSTSTTGFVVLAIVGGAVPVWTLVSRSTRLMAALVKVWLPMAVFGALALIIAGIFVPSIYANLQEVFDATFNKKDSVSYLERTTADQDSLHALVDTYGFGVGWGANRSSSLIPGLLAALGLPGFLLVLWFVFIVHRTVAAARRIGGSEEQRLVMDACAGGVIGFLLSAMISAPTITSPVFFLLLALLIACAVRVQLDAGAAAHAQSRYAATPRPIGAPSGRGLDASNAIP